VSALLPCFRRVFLFHSIPFQRFLLFTALECTAWLARCLGTLNQPRNCLESRPGRRARQYQAKEPHSCQSERHKESSSIGNSVRLFLLISTTQSCRHSRRNLISKPCVVPRAMTQRAALRDRLGWGGVTTAGLSIGMGGPGGLSRCFETLSISQCSGCPSGNLLLGWRDFCFGLFQSPMAAIDFI
jgi:hypothetical protein